MFITIMMNTMMMFNFITGIVNMMMMMMMMMMMVIVVRCMTVFSCVELEDVVESSRPSALLDAQRQWIRMASKENCIDTHTYINLQYRTCSLFHDSS